MYRSLRAGVSFHVRQLLKSQGMMESSYASDAPNTTNQPQPSSRTVGGGATMSPAAIAARSSLDRPSRDVGQLAILFR
jgi:hypothetical protein